MSRVEVDVRGAEFCGRSNEIRILFFVRQVSRAEERGPMAAFDWLQVRV